MEVTCSNEMAELNRIYKETDHIYSHYAASQGISVTTLCILYSLCLQQTPCTQSQLAEDWGIPMQTINSSLKTLEQQGLLQRKLVDGNRKSKHILLTQAGEQFAQKVVAPVIQAENQALDGLMAEERQQLLSLTRKHIHLLQSFLLDRK